MWRGGVPTTGSPSLDDIVDLAGLRQRDCWVCWPSSAWSGLRGGWFGGWRPMIQVVLVLAAVSVLTGWLKPAIGRPRPPADLALTQVTGAAMPSSHALITSAIVVAVVMADWWASARLRRALFVGVVGCLLVGAAMVYSGPTGSVTCWSAGPSVWA